KCGPAWQWPRNANRLTPRMILPLGVALELGTVKVNFAQISLAVLLGFIIEVRRGGMSALAPRGDGPGSDFVSKFDGRDKAVAARAVPLFRSGIRPRTKRRQRAPERRGEAHGNAGPGVAERLNNVSRQPLETVDVPPGRLPGAKIFDELIRGFRQRLQQNVRRNFGADVVAEVDARLPRVRADAALQDVSPT